MRPIWGNFVARWNFHVTLKKTDFSWNHKTLIKLWDYPSDVIPEKDNDDDDPWLIYDLNSYLETEALDLAFMEDLYEIEDFLKCFHMASASI